MFAALAIVVASAAVAPASPQTDDIRSLTNEHRRVHDAADPLLCSPSLDAIAQAWTQHLADVYAAARAADSGATPSLSHNPYLSLQLPSGWTRTGENVALNGGYAEPVPKMVDQWIASPGHHDNLANTLFTHIGVGYVVDSFGISWGTQVFSAYPTTPDPSLVTVTGTFVDADNAPLEGAAVTATTTGGTATGYVGTYGDLCVALPPGNGTVTLSIGGTPVDVILGATAGNTVSTYVVEPDTSGAGATGLVTQTPTRFLDVRNVDPEVPLCTTVRGRAGVPTNASGVIVNATVARPLGPGNLLVYPDFDGTGATVAPRASTLNFETNRDVANSAFVEIAADGKICFMVRGSRASRVILDVSGYLTPESNVALSTSTRVVDTRPGAANVGPLVGLIVPGERKTVPIAGSAGVPVGATAVIVNITVTGVTGPGNLKVWAAGNPSPGTSVINYAPGTDKANGQIIGLSASGAVNIESMAASAHVIIDVVGYLTGNSVVVPVSPERVVETRVASGIIGPIAGRLAADRVYGVDVGASVPSNATAVVLNVTAVQPPTVGHLRVYPDVSGSGLTSPPLASTLNYIPGRDIPNTVVVSLPASGVVQFYSSAAPTDLVVDLVGYVVSDGT
jgi:hypothetical protein